ncbi:hypothetical protein [Vibrio panuliri]|nr:hypothetical protein [Vibrio panuliri]KAB1454071.1 hypothetical protein F7O85_14330 [Vibrio panuliri]
MAEFKVFKGKLDGLGQSELSKFGQKYSYIKLLDGDDNFHMVKNIATFNTTNSFLKLGSDVELYTYCDAGEKVILGLVADGKRVVDMEDINQALSGMEKSFRKMLIWGVIPSLFLSFIFIGIPLLAVMSYMCWKIHKIMKVLNKDTVKAFLTENGFNV